MLLNVLFFQTVFTWKFFSIHPFVSFLFLFFFLLVWKWGKKEWGVEDMGGFSNMTIVNFFFSPVFSGVFKCAVASRLVILYSWWLRQRDRILIVFNRMLFFVSFFVFFVYRLIHFLLTWQFFFLLSNVLVVEVKSAGKEKCRMHDLASSYLKTAKNKSRIKKKRILMLRATTTKAPCFLATTLL